VLRLKSRGVPDARTGARGDQRVRLVVKLPERIDGDLEKFVEQWAKDHAYDVRSDPVSKP
jgi:DnaJ-class molecular chaperone